MEQAEEGRSHCLPRILLHKNLNFLLSPLSACFSATVSQAEDVTDPLAAVNWEACQVVRGRPAENSESPLQRGHVACFIFFTASFRFVVSSTHHIISVEAGAMNYGASLHWFLLPKADTLGIET